MKSFSEVYQQTLEYNIGISPYISNFLRNPYSYLKARYYIFFASVIVFLLQNSSVHPNTITKLYISLGFIGAVLLAVPITELHYFALLVIFSKGILDWADGTLARMRGITSLTGHILDVYGARIHSLTFIISLGVYQYFYFDNNFYLATLFIYPFCYGTLLTKFSNQYILDSVTSDNYRSHKVNSKPPTSLKKQYSRIYNFFTWFLDDRSRTIDFVLLLILLEHLGGPPLSWLFFVGVNIKWLALWSGSFIFSSRAGSADKILASKFTEMKDG